MAKGATIAEVFGEPQCRDNQDLDARILQAFWLGSERAAGRDIEFYIDQLVEIAVRALSPGVNDPFTAMQCLDQLGASLRQLAERKLPSANHRDEEGAIRVVASTQTLEGALGAAFHLIRQYGSSSPPVMMRMLETLGRAGRVSPFAGAQAGPAHARPHGRERQLGVPEGARRHRCPRIACVLRDRRAGGAPAAPGEPGLTRYTRSMATGVLDLTGNTPLIELKHCSPKPGVRLFAKLEGQNPTGSVKDRIVGFMLQRARAEGRLEPGQEVVEATTGNTGIALAMAGRRLGHPVRLVVPTTAFNDVTQALKAWEPQIEWVEPGQGIKSAILAAQDIARRDGAFLLNQFASPDNPRAHYETTGVEILDQLPEVDAFVCGLGTSGTAMGVGRRLKEHNPQRPGRRRRAPSRPEPPGPAQPGRRLRAADPRPRPARRQDPRAQR